VTGRYGVTSAKTVIIDISKDRGTKAIIYNEKGLKIGEAEIHGDKVQLVSPEYVIVSRYVMKNGVLIVAKSVRDIMPREILSNSKT